MKLHAIVLPALTATLLASTATPSLAGIDETSTRPSVTPLSAVAGPAGSAPERTGHELAEWDGGDESAEWRDDDDDRAEWRDDDDDRADWRDDRNDDDWDDEGGAAMDRRFDGEAPGASEFAPGQMQKWGDAPGRSEHAPGQRMREED